MKTQIVTVNETNYTIAPLDFDQYAAGALDENGELLKRVKVGSLVANSLANAAADSNPDFVPAGDALELFPMVLEISGMTKKPE